MKKILLILLTVMLCACQKQEIQIENKTVQPDDIIVHMATGYLADEQDDEYYIGDGFTVVNCDDINEKKDSEKYIYPIYSSDDIKYLVLVDEDVKFIEANENIKTILQGDFVIVEIGEAIYLLDGSNSVLLAGQQEENDMKQLKKINGEAELLSRLSDNKKKLTTNNADMYCKNMIVVKFKDGDTQKYIEEYSKFCNGELSTSNATAQTYVFKFAEKEYDDLVDLLEETKKLDYVADASLEILYGLDPVKPQESI